MAILFQCTWENSDDWVAALQKEIPGEEIIVWDDDKPLDAAFADLLPGDLAEHVDIAVVWDLNGAVMGRLPNLTAVLSLGAGVDGLLAPPGPPARIPLARLVDPRMGDQMAEYVTAQVLHYCLNFDHYRRMQSRAEWLELTQADTAATHVTILGLGNLGQCCAARLNAFGFQVSGWRQSGRPVEGVTVRSGEDGLAACIGEADFVVCLLPLTPTTADMFDRTLFDQFKDGAVFINCARGALVIEEDLIAALDQGKLRGATLDVFRTEPLPADHPLWYHDKVIVTPHSSSASLPSTGCRILAQQIARARAGEPLTDLVDLGRGY